MNERFASSSSERAVVVYTDGIFDLFHRGHLESLRQSKTLFPNTYLIVGVVDDHVAAAYKRQPIINQDDRYEIVRNVRFVDSIVEGAPLVISEAFILEHAIDVVVHGFSNPQDKQKQESFYETPQRLGKFMEIDYFSPVSTTDIINRIQHM